jgi:hypothetical protein
MYRFWFSIAACILCLSACGDDYVPCLSKGAVRDEAGICNCPDGMQSVNQVCVETDAHPAEAPTKPDGGSRVTNTPSDSGKDSRERDAAAAPDRDSPEIDAQTERDDQELPPEDMRTPEGDPEKTKDAAAPRGDTGAPTQPPVTPPVTPPACTPTKEVCDRMDNDCDGTADNGLTNACGEPCTVAVPAAGCPQCQTASDCAAPSEPCLVATCSSSNRICGTMPKAAHAACGGGVCNGSGKCVPCIDSKDCKTAGASQCSAGRCVECTSAAQCGTGQKCENNECVTPAAFCGDTIVNGTEECEAGFNGWTATSCVKCKRTLWTPCKQASDCWSGIQQLCLNGACTPTVCPDSNSVVDGKCEAQVGGSTPPLMCPPALPGYTVSPQLGLCTLQCSNTGGCPSGLTCRAGVACGMAL